MEGGEGGAGGGDRVREAALFAGRAAGGRRLLLGELRPQHDVAVPYRRLPHGEVDVAVDVLDPNVATMDTRMLPAYEPVVFGRLMVAAVPVALAPALAGVTRSTPV